MKTVPLLSNGGVSNVSWPQQLLPLCWIHVVVIGCSWLMIPIFMSLSSNADKSIPDMSSSSSEDWSAEAELHLCSESSPCWNYRHWKLKDLVQEPLELSAAPPLRLGARAVTKKEASERRVLGQREGTFPHVQQALCKHQQLSLTRTSTWSTGICGWGLSVGLY